MYDRCRERPRFPRINRRHHLASGLVFGNFGGGASTLKYVDSSLYGNHGTLTNMDPATDWVFDATLGRWVTEYVAASTQYVLAGKSLSATPLTIAAWFNPAALNTSAAICAVASAAASNDRWSLQTGVTDVVAALVRRDANVSASSAAFTAANTWYHGAGTYVSSTSRFAWLNGVVGAESTTSAEPTAANLDRTLVGRACGGSTIYFTGKVADVLIWSRALSASEISALADPSNVMLSGLILPPRRRVWAVPSAPVTTTRNLVLGGGVL